jgi:hypothetical protein
MPLSETDLKVLTKRAHVSRRARRFVDETLGGRIYVWEEPFARGWMTVKAGIAPPDGMEFQRLETSRGTLFVSLDTLPRYFDIGLRRFPRRGPIVTVSHPQGGS